MKKINEILFLLFICFAVIGGCDVDFGTDDDGGGGNGGNNQETVQGTILEVLPTRESGVANITVVIIDDDALTEFSDTTTNSGFFSVEGNFFTSTGNIGL